MRISMQDRQVVKRMTGGSGLTDEELTSFQINEERQMDGLQALEEILREAGKIQAIKFLREVAALGLKEAKMVVDTIMWLRGEVDEDTYLRTRPSQDTRPTWKLGDPEPAWKDDGQDIVGESESEGENTKW